MPAQDISTEGRRAQRHAESRALDLITTWLNTPDLHSDPGTLEDVYRAIALTGRHLNEDPLACCEHRKEGGHQVTDNVTGQAVRAELPREHAIQLCHSLNLQAGPGGRYRVDPDPYTCCPYHCYGGQQSQPCAPGDDPLNTIPREGA